MEIITAVLMAACLLGLAYPHTIRARGSFFLGLGGVIVAMAIQALAVLAGGFGARGGAGLIYFLVGLVQIGAFVMLVLGIGGLQVGDLIREITAGFRSFAGPGRRGFPVGPPSP